MIPDDAVSTKKGVTPLLAFQEFSTRIASSGDRTKITRPL